MGIIAHPLALAELRDEAVIISEMILDDDSQNGPAKDDFSQVGRDIVRLRADSKVEVIDKGKILVSGK